MNFTPIANEYNEGMRLRLAAWKADPVQFVRDVFGAEPDLWQLRVLKAMATEPRIAMSACKGPGKSCILAWCIWWFLSSHKNSQTVALSITRDNLKDNLWKELAVWMEVCDDRHNKLLRADALRRGVDPPTIAVPGFLREHFEYTSKRIFSRTSDTWWVSARSFAKSADPTQQANTLAGFHNPDVMIVLDEVGDYPDGVVAAAEAIFASKGQNAKLVVAGNPTDPQGPLGRIVKQDARNWYTVFITGDPDDPERSPRIDLAWAKEQIKTWGRENPWVMVNVLGLFPPGSSNQLIDTNIVLQIMSRKIRPDLYLKSERVWGIDPARFGDDEAVLMKRWGSVFHRPITWRGLDSIQLAAQISLELDKARQAGDMPDAVFLDVGGLGSGVYDQLKALGWEIIGIDFGSKADDGRFTDKRSEIWWRLAEWAKTPNAVMPDDPVLRGELPAPKFTYKKVSGRTCFVLESKEAMKKRGVPSPNRADAAALTFSRHVMVNRDSQSPYAPAAASNTRAKTEYDPLNRR